MPQMPTQVAAVPGAIVVSFPWAGAGAAVTALERAAATLGSQIDTQGGLLPDIGADNANGQPVLNNRHTRGA
jgi:hypothetical protein